MNTNRITFKIFLPDSTITGHSTTPYALTMRNYSTGIYLNTYTGSPLSVTTGCTLSTMGNTNTTLGNDDFKFYIHSNLSANAVDGTSYVTNLETYKIGTLISFYSASTLGNISSLSIADALIRTYP